MTKSHPDEGKSGSNNEVCQEDLLDGTSARTRPFSFQDVMLKRKKREDTTKQVAVGPGVADMALVQDEKVFHSPECHRQIHEGSGPMDTKHTSRDSHKVSSRRRGDASAFTKAEKLVQDKDKGSQNPDAKSKSIGEKNVSNDRVMERKNERRHHSSRKKDGFLSDDTDNGSNKRHARDSAKKERVPDGSRGKSEIDRRKLHNEDRQASRKRKTDGRMSSDSENEYQKRTARDVVQTDKLTDQGRDKSEKVNRHKRHNEEDKTRSRSTGKKHDSGKKDLESTRAHLEESRSQRRRSRSRERVKERGRRSLSRSPKAHKHTSKDKREHGELLSHSMKDRAGREHSDVDKKRISSNGSNSHHRRNTGSLSGLGGYSPRKRKTNAAAKTPSPTRRSPERRTAGWDLQPVEKESTIAGSTLSNIQTISQSLSLNVKEVPSSTPQAPSVLKPIGISHQILSSQMHAIESIQLTQATRPMRRLYVENLPASASEKDLIECINKILLSSGVSYIQGTQPCISCIIHKEKGQALLEFLTPEDASVALSFDGISFSGSSLKLRRPKDYANVITGLPDKSVVAVNSVSCDVADSPHKIFIGGISKLISSKMLLEIARAFGPVKAFHFEFISDINEPCAFLEYVDHSVTSKACAGLNGMKLGGKVVTAVFATPDAVLESVGELPFYGIPEHAKPLLQKATAVLKLKNVLDPEGVLSMSESELDEILEDIRLECSRFGTVKSVNVAKQTNSVGTMEAYEVKNNNVSTDGCDSEFDNRGHEHLGESVNEFGELDKTVPLETQDEMDTNSQSMENNNDCDNSAGMSTQLSGYVEPEDIYRSKVVGDSLSDEIIVDNPKKDEICKPPSHDGNISVREPSSLKNSCVFTEKLANQQRSTVNELESHDSIAGSISARTNEIENKPLVEEVLKLEENNAENATYTELDIDEREELDAPEEGTEKDISTDLDDVFEPGSIFVEYRRAEAACMAAHCLNRRMFDGRVVTVGYVDHDLYQIRFRR